MALIKRRVEVLATGRFWSRAEIKGMSTRNIVLTSLDLILVLVQDMMELQRMRGRGLMKSFSMSMSNATTSMTLAISWRVMYITNVSRYLPAPAISRHPILINDQYTSVHLDGITERLIGVSSEEFFSGHLEAKQYLAIRPVVEAGLKDAWAAYDQNSSASSMNLEMLGNFAALASCIFLSEAV